MTNTATQQTLLDRAPIAREHIARNLDLTDLAADPATATMTRSQLERAIYEFAEDAYWHTVWAAEDGDTFLFVEIENRTINDENELDAWEQALEDRYTPVQWRIARRAIDKDSFVVALTKDQVAYAEHIGGPFRYEHTCERILKAQGRIHETDSIDCVSDALDHDPFPAASSGEEVA